MKDNVRPQRSNSTSRLCEPCCRGHCRRAPDRDRAGAFGARARQSGARAAAPAPLPHRRPCRRATAAAPMPHRLAPTATDRRHRQGARRAATAASAAKRAKCTRRPRHARAAKCDGAGRRRTPARRAHGQRRRIAGGSFALGHVRECRPHREGRHDRTCLRVARDLDGVARQDAGIARRAQPKCAAISASSMARRRFAQAHEQLRDGDSPVAQLMQSAAQEIRLSANLRAEGLKERIACSSSASRWRSAGKFRAAPACSPPSARPRRSSACSARCGAS